MPHADTDGAGGGMPRRQGRDVGGVSTGFVPHGDVELTFQRSVLPTRTVGRPLASRPTQEVLPPLPPDVPPDALAPPDATLVDLMPEPEEIDLSLARRVLPTSSTAQRRTSAETRRTSTATEARASVGTMPAPPQPEEEMLSFDRQVLPTTIIRSSRRTSDRANEIDIL